MPVDAPNEIPIDIIRSPGERNPSADRRTHPERTEPPLIPAPVTEYGLRRPRINSDDAGDRRARLAGYVLTRVVPVSDYFFLMGIFSIPIIGQIICAVFAFRKKTERNRRNLARAFLMYLVGMIVLLGIFAGMDLFSVL